MVGLFHNAQIYHTAPVRGIMEQIFEGRYLFAALYSPDLKPVERLFEVAKISFEIGKTKLWQILSESCQNLLKCSCPVVQNHFRLYRDNHNMWLHRMGL
jgi:transposase